MSQHIDLLTYLTNAFDPDAALQADDPVYVQCDEVRGDENILVELGRKIVRSERKTCHLYSGHRGGGKTTELNRLKKDLEQQGCFVVLFQVVEDEISSDTEYTDILLACTRYLLRDLVTANSTSVLNWLRSRWNELKDLAESEVKLDKLNAESSLQAFTKLTVSLRTEPTLRRQIRDKVNPHTPTLIQALNELIASAKNKLPNGKTKLVVIIDNLDRIAPDYEDGRSNYESIFLDRSEQLKALDCHLVYTAPLAFLYSRSASEAKENYGNPYTLPMVMLQTPDGQEYEPGIAKIRDVIAKRVRLFAPTRDLDTEIFDSPATVKRLCLKTGGHLRELISLMQETINRTETLPISMTAVQRAIGQSRLVYERTVEADQWEILAKVFKTKTIENDDQHRSLLFSRCVLEYRYIDDQGEIQTWYDVHPVVQDIKAFKDALQRLDL